MSERDVQGPRAHPLWRVTVADMYAWVKSQIDAAHNAAYEADAANVPEDDTDRLTANHTITMGNAVLMVLRDLDAYQTGQQPLPPRLTAEERAALKGE